jgi:hypothetical protein
VKANGRTGEIVSLSELTLARDVVAKRVGLVLNDGLAFGRWRQIGKQLSTITDSSAWWLGDWLVFGERQYSDRYRQAVAETSLDYQTLRNYAWVARNVPLSRRRDSLSFQHHAEVAALGPDEQRDWLARAEQDHWSRNELRMRLRRARREAPEANILVRLAVEPERQERWREAAERAQTTVEDWMTGVLDRAATAVLRGARSSVEAAHRVPPPRPAETGGVPPGTGRPGR